MNYVTIVEELELRWPRLVPYDRNGNGTKGYMGRVDHPEIGIFAATILLIIFPCCSTLRSQTTKTNRLVYLSRCSRFQTTLRSQTTKTNWLVCLLRHSKSTQKSNRKVVCTTTEEKRDNKDFSVAQNSIWIVVSFNSSQVKSLPVVQRVGWLLAYCFSKTRHIGTVVWRVIALGDRFAS